MNTYVSLSDGQLAVGRALIERELLYVSGAHAVKLRWAHDRVEGRAVAQVGSEDARVDDGLASRIVRPSPSH